MIVLKEQHNGNSYFFITQIKCDIASFCSGDRVRQLSNILCCSSVSSTMLPSAKNWESVIPKPLQIISSVATEGVVFRLKMLATVDWDRPDSMARRYSLQFNSASNSRMRCFASTRTPPAYRIHFMTQMRGIIVGLCIDIHTQMR